MSYNSRPRFLSISLILGLSLLGFFIFKGLKTFSDKDRVVKVKGLAEMRYNRYLCSNQPELSPSLETICKKSFVTPENKKNRIVNYLKAKGFDETNIKVGSPEISDKEKYYEDQWKNGKNCKRQNKPILQWVVFHYSIRRCEK